MKWVDRLLGPVPEKTTVQDLASGFAVTVARRTQTLVQFLEAEGLAQKALQGQFALNPEGFGVQCLLFLAFPFYVMMDTEFELYKERVRKEFVKALIEIMFEGEELSPTEFAEADQFITDTFREYNEVWQGGATAGEITRRLGALAFERMLGLKQEPPNFKVWS
jgi:hypothetical protein